MRMGPGGIATIIAASALAVISLAIAYAISRLGRLVDEASAAIKDLTNGVTPLVEEVTTTVQLVNGPLHSLNKITKSAEELTTKVTASTESFLDNNKMAMKDRLWFDVKEVSICVCVCVCVRLSLSLSL